MSIGDTITNTSCEISQKTKHLIGTRPKVQQDSDLWPRL